MCNAICNCLILMDLLSRKSSKNGITKYLPLEFYFNVFSYTALIYLYINATPGRPTLFFSNSALPQFPISLDRINNNDEILGIAV